MCFNRFGIRTTGTACAVTIQICPLIRSSRRCTSTSGGRDFPCSTNPKDVEAQVGLIWRLTYHVAHLSRDLPPLAIARWCDMEDKIALIAPGGVLMAEFLEPASHRQACRFDRCFAASYQRDRARGSVHPADIALWLGAFLRYGCAVLDRSPVALRRGRSRRTHCAGCWARHFAGDRVGRTDGSLRPVISFDDDTTGSTSGG